jgi:hypothetical protein
MWLAIMKVVTDYSVSRILAGYLLNSRGILASQEGLAVWSL